MKHLKEFNRIPQGFSNTILDKRDEFCFRLTIMLLADKFTADFDNIWSNKLDPEPMKGNPMKIFLKPNAIPKKVTGASRVPLRYMKGGDSVVQDLMNKKIIVPMSTMTDWCSPAFFVPKVDMIMILVRLVTDYTHLNKFVKRPVHPFHAQPKFYKPYPVRQHSLPN